jgi:hypothetical protein
MTLDGICASVLCVIGAMVDIDTIQAMWMCNRSLRISVGQYVPVLVSVLKRTGALPEHADDTITSSLASIYQHVLSHTEGILSLNGAPPRCITQAVHVTYTISRGRGGGKRRRPEMFINECNGHHGTGAAVVDTQHPDAKRRRLVYSTSKYSPVVTPGRPIFIWYT